MENSCFWIYGFLISQLQAALALKRPSSKLRPDLWCLFISIQLLLNLEQRAVSAAVGGKRKGRIGFGLACGCTEELHAEACQCDCLGEKHQRQQILALGYIRLWRILPTRQIGEAFSCDCNKQVVEGVVPSILPYCILPEERHG